ncbi:saccharopine dehydrogenase family protein [Allohahella marinimesophila]|uniref:Saccharopine dehydrogenase NADP-binding domain-containing protein n=1 Tax=Allohahella marinimesophila TaxID=1054972 RepID=A0ABP7PQK1_9GAMM
MIASRRFDIVLFGATGFTGQLTAEYLARASFSSKFHFAIAGRSRQKLKRLQRRLVSINPALSDQIGLIKADARKPGELAQMAASAKVVLSTAGPFVHHGELLVKACIDAGAHYADITGEPEFVDGLRIRCDEAAAARKVKIINCCGFDSIPHDFGAFYTVQQLTRGLSNESVQNSDLAVEGFVSASGRLSGGTLSSAIHAFSRVKTYLLQRSDLDKPDTERVIRPMFPKLSKREVLDAWACPFPTIDPQIILRSAANDPRYGGRFTYGHYVKVESLLRIVGGAAFLGGVFALSQIRASREWLLSKAGSNAGPSEHRRAKSWFEVIFRGELSLEGDEPEEREVLTSVSGKDPGYDETAKMLAETGLCLVQDARRLPKVYGVVTPVMGLGEPMLKRLQASGIKFRLLEEHR